MKDKIKKISVSLFLAVGELVLGLLLLIDPVGLTSAVIIGAGVLLLLAGAYSLYLYIRLPREDAAKTWKLALAAGLLAFGLSAVINQKWLVQILGTLTTLYGVIIMVSAFMKLQMAVDAFRGKRPFWYLMALSFLASGVLCTLLFIRVMGENTVWIFNGIVLILLAVLEAAYYILGRKNKKAAA